MPALASHAATDQIHRAETGHGKGQQPAPQPPVQRYSRQTRRQTGGPAKADQLHMNDYAELVTETPEEHPFATFVRILGKGKRGARNLTREEAREAMGMLLDEKVEDTQLGAFLMLLRHKEESPEELAGFTEAVRERLSAPAMQVDIDWPTYAGKKRHLPWYLLAARCLAQNGVKVLLHGGGAHTAGRLYTEQLLGLLKIPLCRNWSAVASSLEQDNLAFIPLADWAPQLQRMIDLRNTLGLRSPIHSLARILNPLQARCGLQSIFHPGYQSVHRDASSLLGDTAIVVKGDGGEIEINPDTISHLYGTTGGQPWDEEWPALSPRRHVKPATLDPQQLLALWRGEIEDSYPQLALISTMALALRGLGVAREEAFEQARAFWDRRDKSV
ncbi:Uncharacterized protein ALO68_04870 [Pseudomonas syringae pv. helianthi]|uniref:Glycosyl transferase family 3 N-terminal domain-containing protein n=4 Tax=Pseudomonas syringae group TaxID=136849 RepID=A0A0P9R532_9PSED|nr:Uncharacterized protein ALO68_04870 [Pseudomonas syringae pv. helianthi]